MNCFGILIFFSALFHLGLFAKFHSNSGRVSLPLKFVCVLYLLFVRTQWFIKLCISSTLNNGRECLIGNWSYTATFLTLLIIAALMETTQLRGAAAGQRQPSLLWEKRGQTDPSTLSCAASSSPSSRTVFLLLSAHVNLNGLHQGFCGLLLSSAFLPLPMLLLLPLKEGSLLFLFVYAVIALLMFYCLSYFFPFSH